MPFLGLSTRKQQLEKRTSNKKDKSQHIDDDDIKETIESKPTLISEEEAKSIALKKTGGGTVDEVELDDGEYEIEIIGNDGYEHEVEIDAYTGEIIEFERDEQLFCFGKGGLEKVISTYPKVKIYLAHKADGIREDGYLLSYNRDTVDRLYGVRENEFVI